MGEAQDADGRPVGAAKRALRRPVALALAARARRRRGAVGLALCYHRVGDPPGRPGWELGPMLGSRAFATQLRDLRRAYRLVRARDLFEAAAARTPGARIPLAITFDDDLAAHVSVTAPMLRAAGVPATFFLGGAHLDGPHAYWWHVLQRALDQGMSPSDPLLPPAEAVDAPGGVHRLASAIRELPRPDREALTAALLERIGGEPPEPGLRAGEIEALAADGFEIGFHTREHEWLEGLDDAGLATALEAGRGRLEELAGSQLRTIAYPFGRANGRVADAARAAGFESGFTLEATPVRPGQDPLLLGRFQPDYAGPGQTALALARAASGGESS